jgi:predicted nucleotide-binding protein (sugar kinase/HSP70/actin superfamily)
VRKIRQSKCFSVLLIRLNLICVIINRYRNLICGFNNRVNEFKINKIIIFDLLISVANAVNAFESEKNKIKKAIKKLQDKVNFLKRAKDKIVIYINERVEEKARILEKYENNIAREGKIRLEIMIGADYEKEN